MVKYWVPTFLILVLLTGCSTTNYKDIEGETVTVEKLPDDAPLEERLSQLDKLSYIVTYEMSIENDDEDDSAGFNGEITQYVDSYGNLRQDGITNNEEIRQFIKEDKAYACIKADDKWSCGELQSDQADVQNIGDNIQEYMRQYPLPFTETKKIASAESACYGMSSMGFDIEYCFSPEGVPLLMRTESNFFKMKMEAKSYSLGVAPEDFEFPVELENIGVVSEESASVHIKSNALDTNVEMDIDVDW